MSAVFKILYSRGFLFIPLSSSKKHYLMHHLAVEIKLVSQAQLLLSLFYEASEGRLVPLKLFNNSRVLRVQMTTELFGSPLLLGCCRPFHFLQG